MDKLVKEMVKDGEVRGVWALTLWLLGVGYHFTVSPTSCPAFWGDCVLWAEAAAIIHQSLAA